MISLIAVMNKTIHKGTNVVQRDVGEISGICYNESKYQYHEWDDLVPWHYLNTRDEQKEEIGILWEFFVQEPWQKGDDGVLCSKDTIMEEALLIIQIGVVDVDNAFTTFTSGAWCRSWTTQ